jgi:hypothetical protein
MSTMAKPNKTASKKPAPRKQAKRVPAARASGAAKGLSPAAVDGLARQLSEVTRTLREQQRAIEHLIALHEVAAHDATLPAEPNSTVGSIPRISLVPPRAA